MEFSEAIVCLFITAVSDFCHICDHLPQTSSTVGINFLNNISFNFIKNKENNRFTTLGGGKTHVTILYKTNFAVANYMIFYSQN